MLELKNVSVTFAAGTPDENKALKNINLCINKGDFVVVIGSNGAGKSTLMNAISGNVPCSTGSIFLYKESKQDKEQQGKVIDITKTPEYKRARYISRIFQNPLLGTAGKMTLQDNMTICSKKGARGLTISLNNQKKQQFKKDLRVLGMGLENRLTDNVEQFSGGQRQALTLLMAVMSHPDILLIDEHTAALDPTNATIVMDLTKKFAQEYNLTVLMVTHNMQHALTYGNRLLMMDCGQVIFDVKGKQKKDLTMEKIIQKFHDIKKKDLDNDQMLLG